MATLRDIRKRIRTVQNTAKITNAMKMVAAAKLRKAQEAVESARPYARKLHRLLSEIALHAETAGEPPHPLLERRATDQVELLVMTSDRGLCGGFNSNILRRAERFLWEQAEQHREIRVSTIGRKGTEHFRRKKQPLRQAYTGIFDALNYTKAKTIADELSRYFIADEVDAVYLLFNEFKSAISQQVTVVQLLPIQAAAADDTATSAVDFQYEPSERGILDALLPRYLATELYQALLESTASEHGARMTAMENATRNAKDMTQKLTLQLNRARQAQITGELMEIIAGAEALR
ncbi:MAG: ATP synthase F1 subunit gamma [Deltaproteobacteria bacterium]|nr:ATP synthase F1 subunit gamma [Deltaproteobacteria bacterium]